MAATDVRLGGCLVAFVFVNCQIDVIKRFVVLPRQNLRPSSLSSPKYGR